VSVAAHLVQLDARPGATEDLLKSVLHALLKLLQGQCVRVCVCVCKSGCCSGWLWILVTQQLTCTTASFAKIVQQALMRECCQHFMSLHIKEGSSHPDWIVPVSEL